MPNGPNELGRADTKFVHGRLRPPDGRLVDAQNTLEAFFVRPGGGRRIHATARRRVPRESQGSIHHERPSCRSARRVDRGRRSCDPTPASSNLGLRLLARESMTFDPGRAPTGFARAARRGRANPQAEFKELTPQQDELRSAERLPFDEAREHVVESERGDPCSDVREPVRQHELSGVDHAAARVDDVGHVPVTLVL